MKLSEAIREGARKSGPQLFGILHGVEGHAEGGGACAMGAALSLVWGWRCLLENGAHLYPSACEKWPLLNRVVILPCGCQLSYKQITTLVAIVHLNNVHRWTREAIAEWVGTVEKEMEAEAEKVAQVATEPVVERALEAVAL